MGASSTFTHASLSKALILGTALLSLVLSGHQHYLDLPLKPHLTRDYQFWRVLTHHAACSNSADLFLIVLILWHTSVPVERRFGSVNFLIVTILVGSTLELVALIISHNLFRYRAIPSGPFLITFAILYQHHSIAPSLYDYRIGRIHFDSHSLVPDFLCLILGLFNPISSLAGVLVGAAYRSDQLGLNRWRLRSTFLLSPISSDLDRRRKPRPSHATLEDDPRFESSTTSARRPIHG